MATEATLSVEERLYRLLRYLDVDQAHFAGSHRNRRDTPIPAVCREGDGTIEPNGNG